MMLTSSGYVYEKIHGHPLADKRGRVRQHRRVWFENFGPIPDGHIVHHVNGDKTDNRIENLELCDRAHHGLIHKPNGLGVPPWNKGKTAYTTVSCDACGTTFQRKQWHVTKAAKHGWKVACSAACRAAIKSAKRLKAVEENT